MRVVFRADGSKDLGLGHIVRCLTLADELRTRDPKCDILFVTKYDEGRRVIERRAHRVAGTEEDEVRQIRELAAPGTLVITDFLDTDSAFTSRVRGTGVRVMALDNNTRLKRIDADVVVNANVFDEGQTGVVGSTRYYLGPRYMVLRREFGALHKQSKEVADKVRTILVLSGGGDLAGGRLALSSVRALERIDEKCRIHLVVGPTFPYTAELNALVSSAKRRFDVSVSPANLPELMRGADLAVTAAGITLYELAALGVPCLVVPLVTPQTRHQEDIARAFERHGACLNLGGSPGNDLLCEKAAKLMADKSLRRQLSEGGKALVDGGGLERALGLVLEVSNLAA